MDIYTGCLENFISFHKLISKRIPMLVILSACFYIVQHFMFSVFIFTDIEMPFTES